MVMPDFEEWANTVKLSRFPDAIQAALKDAFEQGRHLGKREQESLWWEAQDRYIREPVWLAGGGPEMNEFPEFNSVPHAKSTGAGGNLLPPKTSNIFNKSPYKKGNRT